MSDRDKGIAAALEWLDAPIEAQDTEYEAGWNDALLIASAIAKGVVKLCPTCRGRRAECLRHPLSSFKRRPCSSCKGQGVVDA